MQQSGSTQDIIKKKKKKSYAVSFPKFLAFLPFLFLLCVVVLYQHLSEPNSVMYEILMPISFMLEFNPTIAYELPILDQSFLYHFLSSVIK